MSCLSPSSMSERVLGQVHEDQFLPSCVSCRCCCAGNRMLKMQVLNRGQGWGSVNTGSREVSPRAILHWAVSSLEETAVKWLCLLTWAMCTSTLEQKVLEHERLRGEGRTFIFQMHLVQCSHFNSCHVPAVLGFSQQSPAHGRHFIQMGFCVERGPFGIEQ